MNLFSINAIKALYYTAIINGVLAIPLIAIIIKLANNKRIIGKFTTNKINNVIA